MAGLYVHLPFCASRCVYCGFYSTTATSLRARYVEALRSELLLRCGEAQPHWHTVYLGGGTPSLLSVEELTRLFEAIDTQEAVEVTIECNPDDLTPQFCEALSRLPVNRVSMGAQTFSNSRLKFLHRRHCAEDVAVAVERLRRVGIANISVDLMYGFPGETLDEWRSDIRETLRLHVEHLSAYCLSIEPDTALSRMVDEGRVELPDEETTRAMYYELLDLLAADGYEHYELSNFARPGFRSRHNSSYWDTTPYMGIGAAAHSYDGKVRQWNVGHLHDYLHHIESGHIPEEHEVLDASARYDDMVMLRLRTREGLSLSEIERQFGTEALRYLQRNARNYLDSHLLALTPDGRLRLTREALFVSDMVTAELMRV